MANCWSPDPNPAVYFVVTMVNILKLVEFVFLLYVSSNSMLFRRKLRRMCCRVPIRKGSTITTQSGDDNQQEDPEGEAEAENEGEALEHEQEMQEMLLLPEGFGFTTLDALRVSQVSSIVMGIYLSQVEYMQKLPRV